MTKRLLNRKTIIGAVSLLLFVLLFYLYIPNNTGAYTITVWNSALIYFMANIGTAIMLGSCGMVSFASPAFMGLGAYTSVYICMNYGVNPFITMLIGMLVSMLFAVLIGMALMRLNGTFFTFSTVALCQIAYTVYNGWKPVTGGPNGIPRVPQFTAFGWVAKTYFDNYYVLLTIAIIAFVLANRLGKTNFGRAMNSVRDNELVAKTTGINVFRTKVTAFAIAAGFAGIAGACLAHSTHYVVSTYFTYSNATMYIIQVMIGGVYNIVGVFAGTILITMLPEWLRPLQEYIKLVYGVGVILLMIFMPMGIWGLGSDFIKRIKKRYHIKDNVTPIGVLAEDQEVGK
ncbi:MAG: branched-chain amino acid ABC transporter permease [Erysipelotrichaceae bacterium]|nr:branched-chain amino acid ABC transporter permease [Erysipelotrichaceae bacterium]